MSLDIRSIFLEGIIRYKKPCSPADTNSSFAIFQFPMTACGTTVMKQGEFVVYENKMVSSHEVGIGLCVAITRDSHYDVEALFVEVNNIPPPLPVAASGPLRMELRLANG
ncbi:zona pellucida glycoprotein 2, like 1 [Hoplias malabaricus]|uniref:zona pellucida glycoprotein 2, like 1 n=1 Tax=Hoplias malabaricus TaxID=27720 RepID=UPI003462E7D4